MSLADFITFDPWVWWALGLIVLAVLLALAHHYDEHRLPRARETLDEHQARDAVRPTPAPIDILPKGPRR